MVNFLFNFDIYFRILPGLNSIANLFFLTYPVYPELFSVFECYASEFITFKKAYSLAIFSTIPKCLEQYNFPFLS